MSLQRMQNKHILHGQAYQRLEYMTYDIIFVNKMQKTHHNANVTMGLE